MEDGRKGRDWRGITGGMKANRRGIRNREKTEVGGIRSSRGSSEENLRVKAQ